MERELNFTKGFNERYLVEIIDEFKKFKEYGDWTFSAAYDGEIIRPEIKLENGELEYQGMFLKVNNENRIITDPFRIIVVLPEVFYARLKIQLKKFINDYKTSVNKTVRDSFIVEVRRGKNIVKSDLERSLYTLD